MVCSNKLLLSSALSLSLQTKASSLLLVDYTSIMIGLAVFGQWSGLLRFLSYLDKYNMLILTLRLSFPSVIRFIICTGILYIAFLLCGWLVLGPYHPKVCVCACVCVHACVWCVCVHMCVSALCPCVVVVYMRESYKNKFSLALIFDVFVVVSLYCVM